MSTMLVINLLINKVLVSDYDAFQTQIVVDFKVLLSTNGLIKSYNISQRIRRNKIFVLVSIEVRNIFLKTMLSLICSQIFIMCQVVDVSLFFFEFHGITVH